MIRWRQVLANNRACIYRLGRVSSRHEADNTSIASLEHMFFKARTAGRPTARGARQERPKVHTTRGGVVYVDVNELFESEVGQKALRDLEEITKRLGLDSRAPVPATLDRTSAGE